MTTTKGSQDSALCRDCGATDDDCTDTMLASDSRSLCCLGCTHAADTKDSS